MEMRALSSVFCEAKSRGSEVERDEGTEVAESVWLRFTGGWGPNRDPRRQTRVSPEEQLRKKTHCHGFGHSRSCSSASTRDVCLSA